MYAAKNFLPGRQKLFVVAPLCLHFVVAPLPLSRKARPKEETRVREGLFGHRAAVSRIAYF